MHLLLIRKKINGQYMYIRFSNNEQSGREDDSASELLQLAHHEDTNVKESTGSIGPTKDV